MIETTEAYDVADAVVVDLSHGSLVVGVHDSDEIVVRRRVERVPASPTIDESHADGVLSLDASSCRRPWWLLPRLCSVSYTLLVPAGTDLQAETRHGDMHVSSITGELVLRTGHGEVTVTDVDGSVHVETGHGGVLVMGGAGPVHVTTSHGSITIDGAAVTEAMLLSGHGDVDVDVVSPPDRVDVVTSHGSVAIRLPRDSTAYAVTTSTGHGQATVTVPVDQGATRSVDVRTGHGQIEVSHG